MEPFPIWAPGEIPAPTPGHDQGECEGPLLWGSLSVRNVSVPTLTPFPATSPGGGTSLIICPGGGFHFLMIDKEGREVARWLSAAGISCFLLKYRLAPTPRDDEEFKAIPPVVGQRRQAIRRYGALAMADGLQAVRVLRRTAEQRGIRRDRIGIMGFSAGGMVAASAAMSVDTESRPDFAGAIYAGPQKVHPPAQGSPPLFIAYANDDDVVQDGGLALLRAWNARKARCEMHVFSRGGHGFGMSPQGLPSDAWIQLFHRWLQAEGLAG